MIMIEQIVRDLTLAGKNYLFDLKKMVIIDEFQNFLNVDKSIIGEIQHLIDSRKFEDKFYKLIVCGSSYSMMNKIFNSTYSPLYGRRTYELKLEEIKPNHIYKELNFNRLEDFIKYWAVFGGVIYYYEFLNFKETPEENLISLFFEPNSFLRDEGYNVLSMEFNVDSKVYFTILSAISKGKTKLNEIASLFDNKKTTVIKYLEILRKEYKLIQRITPIFSNPKKEKQGYYEIYDNFLKFWFMFVENKRDYFEQERYEEIKKHFLDQFSYFLGFQFEKFVKVLLKEHNFTVGKWWHKDKEIDIVSYDDSKLIFGECKWKDKINPKQICKELIEKIQYVDIPNNLKNNKIQLWIFAKSFKEKITEFEDYEVKCIDLEGLEKIFI